MIAAEAAAVADDARRRLGVGHESPVPDILRLLEDNGVRVFGERLGLEGPDGAYRLTKGIPFILLNVSKPTQRMRFTLAHEYGHHLLSHGTRPPETVSTTSKDPREREANRFAAGFLMPGQGVHLWLAGAGIAPEHVDLTALCRMAAAFGVSVPAMRYRLEELGILRRGTAQLKGLAKAIEAGEHRELIWRESIPQVRDSLVDAHQRGYWVPLEFGRRLARMLEGETLEEDQVARHLPTGMTPDDLKVFLAEALVEAGEANDL
ncbi:MAG TPA: ImmA/IrrE family metallo-endopeptidase [Miltoncostaeaceae bacterium]|nr:ImmA/IrrE family metallo-endopeptidase [Miltoncostaeaceae bacterium]